MEHKVEMNSIHLQLPRVLLILELIFTVCQQQGTKRSARKRKRIGNTRGTQAPQEGVTSTRAALVEPRLKEYARGDHVDLPAHRPLVQTLLAQDALRLG